MLELILTALTTLLVTVGPIEGASIFVAITRGMPARAKSKIALSACAIAGIVLLAFALGGIRLLELLGVGLPAFRTAGGVLLLKLAADLLLAHRSELTGLSPSEEREAAEEAAHRANIAVFPLAIPMIAGPGSMTAAVLLMSRAPGMAGAGVVVAIIALVCALTFTAMLAGDRLVRLLGVTGASVIARVSGLILAALAMQYVFDGLRDSGVFS